MGTMVGIIYYKGSTVEGKLGMWRVSGSGTSSKQTRT